MKTHFDIEKIVQKGTITNGLDYERALVADKKLRLLAKESLHFKKLRMQLRDLIVQYETVNWNDANAIEAKKLAESEKQERLAEQERLFIENRKKTIEFNDDYYKEILKNTLPNIPIEYNNLPISSYKSFFYDLRSGRIDFFKIKFKD
jgi:hypothetical protein